MVTTLCASILMAAFTASAIQDLMEMELTVMVKITLCMLSNYVLAIVSLL